MLRRSLKSAANVLPVPQERSEAGLRLAKTSARIRDGPVTDEMVLLEFSIELFKRHCVLAFAPAKIEFKVQSSMFKVRTSPNVEPGTLNLEHLQAHALIDIPFLTR